MNEEIKNHIISKCEKMGMKIIETNYWRTILFLENDNAIVKILVSPVSDEFYFEFWSYKLGEEQTCRFAIPETLRGFIQVCNILKIFHN